MVHTAQGTAYKTIRAMTMGSSSSYLKTMGAGKMTVLISWPLLVAIPDEQAHYCQSCVWKTVTEGPSGIPAGTCR